MSLHLKQRVNSARSNVDAPMTFYLLNQRQKFIGNQFGCFPKRMPLKAIPEEMDRSHETPKLKKIIWERHWSHWSGNHEINLGPTGDLNKTKREAAIMTEEREFLQKLHLCVAWKCIRKMTKGKLYTE